MAFSRSTTARAKSLILLSVMLIAVGNLNGLVAGQTIVLPTFTPTDDASVRFDEPTRNLRSATTLQVDRSPIRDFLIKFNVTGVESARVVSAKLRLFQVDSSPRGGDFHTTSPNWSEQTVNWSNAPPADPSTIASLGAVSSGVWYEVDITSAVSGDGPVSLRVNSSHSDGAYYSSKEGVNSPELVVTVEIVVPDPLPPSQPQGLTAVAVSHTRVDLSWQESTDNVAVTGYDVYRNDSLVATVDGATTQQTDATVSPSTPYSYVVIAFDAAGNRSPPSDQVVVVTPEPPSFANLIFAPTDDAYILAGTSGSGDGNFGREPQLAVDNSPLKNFLLKFNVTGVDTGEVLTAKLRLFQTDSSPRGGDFRKTSSTWSERTITWNNAPAAEPALIASLGPVASQTWYEVNVASAIAGDGLISFRVSSPNSDGAYYSSKEGANPPLLNVTVANLAQSSISLLSTPNPSSVAETVTFSGTLSNSTGGELPNRRVEVQSLVSSSWTTIATAFTQADGTYNTGRRFSSAGTYQLRAMFSGDATYRSSTSSVTAQNVTGQNTASFAFAAAGDLDAQPDTTTKSLEALASSDASFFLALGDLSYGTMSESAWCNYVTSKVGTTFPFELLAGNHEGGEEIHGHGLIDNFAQCLPDKLGVSGVYAKEYYFDYPSGAPVARFVMIAPDVNFTVGGFYSYSPGSFRLAWLSATIDEARGVGIPWVIVGMHKVCLSTGVFSCEIGRDLMNFLVEKRVDLVLQGHDHSYQRSHQLGLSPSCTNVPASPSAINLSCITDDERDGVYEKGAGTVFVIAGIFGAGLTGINGTDPEAPYFERFFGSNSPGRGHGFVKYTVSETGISGDLVLATGGPFPDSFTIVHTGPDTEPPSAPENLNATPETPLRVRLSWNPSTDNSVIARYDVFRNDTNLASVGGGTTTYTDTTVTSPSAYRYTVRAFDAAENPSLPSNEARISFRTLVFLPTDDAFIGNGTTVGSVNHGSEPQLVVDSSPLRDFLLKFSVTNVGTAQVVTAKLRLFQTDSSPRGGDFHTTSPDWSEQIVTWNNAPSADPAVIASLGSVTSNTWYEVDLTVIVSGDGVVSLRVNTPNSDGAFYSSKEGANPPQLVITVSATF